MQCDRFEDRLNEILDSGGTPTIGATTDGEMLAHAQHCAACRTLAAALGAAIEGTGQIPSIQAPVDMAARVLNELAKADAQLQVSPRGAWTVRFPTHRTMVQAMAIAAALVVAVSLWIFRPLEEQGRGGPGPIVQQPPAESIAPIESLAWVATDQYRNLAEQTRDSLASALLILPGDGLLDNGPTGTPAASDSLLDPQWSQEVTAGFEPLTRSTAGALDSLWRTLPLAAEESRS